MSRRDEGEDVAQDVYRALTKAFLLLDDLDRRFFAEEKLSARQFWALQHLSERDGRPMVELGQLLLTDKSNVTGIVDRLEREGLVVRRPSSTDRRVMLITLTPKGRRLRDTVNARHEALVEELIGSLGEPQLHSVLGLLGQISRNLETYLETRPRAALASSG
jgi:MarR family 2-MHQ and catechol resistance regulon transcriptional repressor